MSFVPISPVWEERETELLTILRPSFTNHEIATILSRLGYNRSVEAVSRKSRRMQIKFQELGEPVGELSETESVVVDQVLGERLPVLLPTDEEENYTISSVWPGAVSLLSETEPSPEEWTALANALKPQEELDTSVKWVTGDLLLREDRPTRFVMLNDVHVPHNIPLSGIWDFCRDFKPDYLLLVGDIINNDPFSHWEREKPGKAKKMPQPKNYYRMCNQQFYRPAREAVGDGCVVVHWIGNHEWWSSRVIEMMPEGEGYWEVWNNVEPDLVDFWVPNRGMANLGHLFFVHGDLINGGKNHPSKFLQYFNRNIRYGHYHDLGTASHIAPIDMRDRHVARCNGCLEQYNPHFMGNRPHNWQHAFSYGYVRPDGTFNDYQVVIFDNKFIVNDREYQGK